MRQVIELEGTVFDEIESDLEKLQKAYNSYKKLTGTTTKREPKAVLTEEEEKYIQYLLSAMDLASKVEKTALALALGKSQNLASSHDLSFSSMSPNKKKQVATEIITIEALLKIAEKQHGVYSDAKRVFNRDVLNDENVPLEKTEQKENKEFEEMIKQVTSNMEKAYVDPLFTTLENTVNAIKSQKLRGGKRTLHEKNSKFLAEITSTLETLDEIQNNTTLSPVEKREKITAAAEKLIDTKNIAPYAKWLIFKNLKKELKAHDATISQVPKNSVIRKLEKIANEVGNLLASMIQRLSLKEKPSPTQNH